MNRVLGECPVQRTGNLDQASPDLHLRDIAALMEALLKVVGQDRLIVPSLQMLIFTHSVIVPSKRKSILLS